MYNDTLIIINSKIITKNLPDKDIEIFWYSWKNTIYNAFKRKKIAELFNLDKYSNYLNKLQEINDYEAIQMHMQKYIEEHIIMAIENYISSYHCNILDTHLKRWVKLTNKSLKLDRCDIKNSNYNFKLFSLYLTILNNKHISDLDKSILLDHVIAYRFNRIVDFTILHNKCNILDRILVLDNVKEYICNKYNISYHSGTKGNKILKKINESNK